MLTSLLSISPLRDGFIPEDSDLLDVCVHTFDVEI